MTVTVLGVPWVARQAEGPATARPSAGPLIDSYGRGRYSTSKILSTDRCNLRCTYCMPAEGVPGWPPNGCCNPTMLFGWYSSA